MFRPLFAIVELVIVSAGIAVLMPPELVRFGE